MSIVLDGTAGITTPEITSAGGPLVVNASAPDNSVVVDAGGNVGIGTSSPATQLHVSKAGSTAARVTNTSIGAYAELGRDSTGAYVEASGAYPLQFYTNGSERARIDSSGNLLVGTTSATGASKFVVAADTTTANPMTVSNTRSTAATDYSVLFFRNASLVGSIQTSLSATSYVTSSDYRLKHDIAPMTGALAKVAALKPVTYKWTVDDSAGEGFIAHELAEVVPECVTGEKDAVDAEGNPQYQGIDTSFLVATLTAALQEQQAIITALTARVEALEGAQA